MDEVQKFIASNSHQFGYIMQEASRQWVEKDPIGALTVGECNYFVEKCGQYHELLEKVQRYEKALKTIIKDSELYNTTTKKTAYSYPGKVAIKALGLDE